MLCPNNKSNTFGNADLRTTVYIYILNIVKLIIQIIFNWQQKYYLDNRNAGFSIG